MMLQVKQPKLSHSWWFDSHKSSPRSSTWLASTLQELDEKTKVMLKLIEQDADSFAQRAEMYYKKRPELVNMVEDFYRAHRSLAERYDLLRSETGARRLAHPGSPTKSWSQNSKNTVDKESRTSSNSFESGESEIEDPEQEEDEVSSEIRETSINEACENQSKEETGSETVKRMTEELERLREENVGLNARLLEKDEEKREVIRQLSLSMDILKEENAEMRKCLKESNKWGPFGFKMPKKGLFQGMFLGGFARFHPAIMAL
ncbi:unnamed protein product [Spirodela intermedia]|uniref:NAB domain-containing protein n=1 Tax=Spirodela intermedia TaxID=51605 RepID=A0A7I8KSG3_SPIIN|nr:unnamed protein product [Spirodela intermedia]